MSEQIKIKVTSEIRHNGTIYKTGTVINDIDEISARRLVELGAGLIIKATSSENKGNAGKGGENPPSAFAGMTAKQQIEHLTALSDGDFLKFFKQIENEGKSKTKTYALQRKKMLGE